MRLLNKAKDGGKDSPVDGYFLIELKSLFSIVLLKFNKGGREQFHTHAFNAFTWFLKGNLIEEDFNGTKYIYQKSLVPKITKREKNHRVKALEDSWCLSIRVKWRNTWTEDDKDLNTKTYFTHHRKIIWKTNN